MNWIYVNPFWHRDRLMSSVLNPDECRRRLKMASSDRPDLARLWIGRGELNFAETGPRVGSLFEMHVGIKVTEAPSSGSLLHLRFSGGLGSAIVFCVIAAACLIAFAWAVMSLVSSGSWIPGYGAGLLAIVVPVLLAVALRSEAPGDEDDLWNFIAGAVDGNTV